MINTSPEFQQAVYAPVRKTAARVTFEVSDVTAADDATATVTSQAEISRRDQLTNQKWDRPAYAAFEPDYWRLDGSFVLPPKSSEPGFEVGWYSDVMSGADGTFSPHQVLDFSFSDTHSSLGLTVTFDPAKEYASDFDIVFYNASGNVIRTVQVRGNTRERYVYEEQIYLYKRVVVTLIKWCKPNRRAKVTEVSFGVIREYEDESLIKLNIIEELIPTSETIPANELKFTVDNSSKEFNILNPVGIYKFLMQRQSAVVELGVEVAPGVTEYIGMGYYYLTDWQSDEGSLTATFTARNRIDFIPNIEIENSIQQNTNLYDLSLAVIRMSGIKNYHIDTSLKSIATQSIYKKMTYRQLLQNIAVASRCAMFVDRNDFLNIQRKGTGSAVDEMTFDNIYKEPQIKLDKLVSRVEVAYYSGTNQVGTSTVTGPIDGGVTLKVENTLINGQSHAQDVATWILNESNNRVFYDVNWRQNPALECGDIVSIEDSYGANKDSRIVRQEYEYSGYLKGKTKTMGGL